MTSMLSIISFLFRCLSLLGVLFATNAFVPSSWGYDAQPRANIDYDGASLLVFDYDRASFHPRNQSACGVGKAGDIRTKFAAFVAAKTPPTLDALSQAAGVADRGGLTAAGRSLTKHGAGARPGNTLFPAAKGNPATINQSAQNVVDDILTTPGSTIQNSTRGRFGPTIEATAPDGRGIVYDANGKFLFFKE